MKIVHALRQYLFITIILSLTMHTYGQGPVKNYSTEWKKVDDLIGKGLDMDALEEIKSIYQLAKKDKQEAQAIKAAIYMIQVQSGNRENNVIASIRELEKEMAEASGAGRAILTSLVASQYLSYYHTVRWQLYNRTATVNFDKANMATWGTGDFHRKISELFLESIRDEELLKQTPLEPYDAIIFKGNVRKLRPTLFDLLAFNSLAYFSSDERNVPKPAHSFEINTASAFDPAADFIHRKFTIKDSLALEHRALLLYQKLIAFHIQDPTPDALIDVDLARIEYVRQKSVHPDKDSLYYMAVNHVAEQYQSMPAAAQAWYLKAAWFRARADQYKPDTDSLLRYENLKAIAICEKIIAENPDAEGGINAFNLLNMVRQMQLGMMLERVNVPNQPFRALVNFKNVKVLHFRLIKADAAAIANYEGQNYDSRWKVLARHPAMRTWTQALPDTRDYQQHNAEIKVEGLPTGDYILLAGTDPDFKEGMTIMASRLFYVSNLSYIQKNDRYFVLNRESGQPVANASVQIWYRNYNYGMRKNDFSRGALLKTDANGQFIIPVKPEIKSRGDVFPEITHGEDHLFLRENRPMYHPGFRDIANETDDEVDEIYLFTDRGIYRPGQTVYYKGIARKGNQVLKDRKYEIEVRLQNANAADVHAASHYVNEYGSFSGSFQLPQNGLTGDFSITAEQSHIGFKVEEYKRPRFEVVFDTLKNSYKVNDTIHVSGMAVAYAGNAINETAVKYRVVRSPRIIYSWPSKRMWPMPTSAEIAHGETATDASGNFRIDFEALPDLHLAKDLDPVFDYAVYADITDLNGETRSNKIVISVSYKSFILKSEIPEKARASEFKSLTVRTQNLSDAPITTNATIRFTRISPENRLIRQRYWPKPDVFVMSKNEYVSAFPHDEYNAETEKENWESIGEPLIKTLQLGPERTISIADLDLPAGFYRIQITAKSAANEEVSDTHYIELTAPQKTMPYPSYLWAEEAKPIEPGEKTTISLGSSADNLFLINAVQKKAKDNFSFTSLDNEVRVFQFTATEDDRGGYLIHYLFVKHNRIHSHLETIKVPWTNKQLKITYETFRDKTLPGSRETWKIRVSGLQKEQVASEMLGSMYDASLDQLYMHRWYKPEIWRMQHAYYDKTYDINFSFSIAEVKYGNGADFKSLEKTFDRLKGANGTFITLGGSLPGATVRGQSVQRKTAMTGALAEVMAAPSSNDPALNDVVVAGYGQYKGEEPPKEASPASAPRKNLVETAFFFPDLKTDANGDITFSFTMPEALTRWKFQALAHSKNLALGYSSKEIITQKELMVQPNAPRFLREGDRLSFPVKIANLSSRELKGNAALLLMDTETNEALDGKFGNNVPSKPFTVAPGQSSVVFFNIQVPKGFSGILTWRATAQSGELGDGEENVLPVLPNRMLVTESMPISTRGQGDRAFTFEKLKQAGNSPTLRHQSLTVEYSSNPAWYAVQSLPYLMEYPYECAEQTWNRYYANTLASHIVHASPRIAQVFKSWKGTGALQSNLSKNQELKSLLLQETPWVLASKTEEEQQRNVALLFDLARMENELNASMLKLQEMQSSNGGFVWFKGGPDDRYITQYIVTGIGHLQKIKAFQPAQQKGIDAILEKAIPYLDKRIQEDYNNLVKYKTDLKSYVPGPAELQYLYARSFFNRPIPAASQKAYQYYRDRAGLTWVSQSKLLQGMTALVAHRTQDNKTANQILESLRQTAIHNEELGMYWKTGQRGWWWHEAPIERQALLIEVFQEIGNDQPTVAALKTWLLKHKQTNSWESTKATAEACYALLMTGSDWISETNTTTIRLGDTEIRQEDNNAKNGTGYFKKTIDSGITATMANVALHIEGKSASGTPQAPGWGSVYWQYFEDLDKITFAETPLKLSKQLFIETNTDSGPVLIPVREGGTVTVGDKIKVRIELRVDRDMEYVHMKDMRASGLEPVNVLSGYRWQGGLGYYESTRDASTNFFFNALQKGTYVFEYPLFITHEGDFSNGITTIQCMYAPEFTAHSEGVRLKALPRK